MDKQVKLIDADKLLDQARVGGNVTTYSELVEWIESGVLAPDPVPLPTIKQGDKVRILDAMDPKYIGRETTVVKVNLNSPFSARLENPSGWWMFSSLEVIE